jgi:plasmid stabilization system protein ParE
LGAHRDRESQGDYLIFYESIPRSIQVLRVLHGARDWHEII